MSDDVFDQLRQTERRTHIVVMLLKKNLLISVYKVVIRSFFNKAQCVSVLGRGTRTVCVQTVLTWILINPTFFFLKPEMIIL